MITKEGRSEEILLQKSCEEHDTAWNVFILHRHQQPFLYAKVDDVKITGRKAKLVPMPFIDPVFLECIPCESETERVFFHIIFKRLYWAMKKTKNLSIEGQKQNL